MSRPLLVLRPQPGADRTTARIGDLGLDAIVAPLFVVRPVAWEPATATDFDAILLTSANAARHGGDALRALTTLPVYAVGQATAERARAVGFATIHIGAGDGAAAVGDAAADGRRRLLHLTGRDHGPLPEDGLRIERRIVYASDPVAALPDAARAALAAGGVALLHSARAARHLRVLVEQAGLERSVSAIAAISPAVLAAAGDGWGAAVAADRPDDMALLAAAARLCN